MQRTSHTAPALPEREVERLRSKKLANAAIMGLGVVLIAGTGITLLQDDRAEVRSAQAAATYSPPIEAPPIVHPDRVLFVGDSYTAGSNMGGMSDENWTRKIRPMVRDEDHPVDYITNGLGGSGYLATGSADKTFLDGVKERLTPGTEVVVVFGSRNDPQKLNGTNLEDAATQLYEYLEKNAPKAQLVVIGPQAPYDEPNDDDRAIAEAIRTSAETHADFFLDPIAEDWFDDEMIIGEDKVHPTDEGHTVMAERIAPTLRDALEAAWEEADAD